MDRSPHEYPYAQQQHRQAATVQQQQPQQFGYHPQHQQFQIPPPPFIPPHSPIPHFSYPHHLPPQQQPSSSHLHPHLPRPQALHQQPPPPSFPHIIPSPFPQYETPPPSDPELQKRIEKLVKYSVKNGPEFEAMIREKQQSNPEYSFLFGGEGHGYYRYKLWISTRPPGSGFNQPFTSSSLPMIHPPPSPLIPSPVGGPGAAVGSGMVLHQLPFQPFYDPHHPPPLFGPNNRPPFDVSSHQANPPSLPPDIAVEFNNIIMGLNGTKESIKAAKNWFTQSSQFASSLAEALKNRVSTWDDSEKQLHIIYLVNDILFDGLQRRVNIKELDSDATTFKPLIGSMLARIYHNPCNKEDNQTRLLKIIQFWGSKEVYDLETIRTIEAEMMGSSSEASSSDSVLGSQATSQTPLQWHPERQAAAESDLPEKRPFIPSPFPATNDKAQPFPLFPPGLIPGMVRKMQIGSGVPYSSLSPLDIPSVIPPSEMSPSDILERVSRFFKEVGESSPPEMGLHSKDDYDSYATPIRKGGACIPPPPNLQVDPERGAYADGTVERKSGGGSGRLGLGATADPNEPSQYDDVYTSYRKHRSTSYHSSMSARAGAR